MTGFGAPGYAGPSPPTGGANRLGYLDWTRGLAVLAMIHTHAFGAWTVREDQTTPLFGFARLIGGFPAPLFLFIGGVAAALVAQRERARGCSDRERRRRAARRALTVAGYAVLFRVGMWVSGGFGPPADLLRVDILNCIAVSLVLVALPLSASTERGRVVLAVALAGAIALATPLVRDGARWQGWPPAIAGYATGRVPGAAFPMFPWAAYALLGAACGVGLASARAQGREGRTVALLAGLGAAAIPIAVVIDARAPALYARYDYWYTSPWYVLLKAGVVLILFGAAYVVDRLPGPSALRVLGRTSLLVYWAHLEIIYGRWIAPSVRGTLSIEEAAWAVLALSLAMVALAVGRTSAHGWRLPRGLAEA